MGRVLKFRAFFNGQMSSPFHLGEGVCWPDGRVSTANKVGEVMQFTGLLDKNGVEIYCGDIVKCLSLSNDHAQKGAINLMTVKFFMGSFCFCFKDADSGVPIYPLCVSLQMEVIGNIHEHPELLEQQ